MKKFITLIALAAIAGSASAAVIAGQDFTTPATGVGTGAWTYDANLDATGGDVRTTTNLSASGSATLNSSIDYGNDADGSMSAGDLWMSYRFVKAASSQWKGASTLIGGALWRDGAANKGDIIGFEQYDLGNGANTYGSLHYKISIGGETFEDTDLANEIAFDQDVDLFVVGKFSYLANGDRTFYMTSIDWADRATLTEADVMAGFSASSSSAATDTIIDTLGLTLHQYDETKFHVLDDIIAGDDFVDVIPEPATVGMLGLGALVAMLIRRMQK